MQRHDRDVLLSRRSESYAVGLIRMLLVSLFYMSLSGGCNEKKETKHISQ